jgi:3-oxoacyl-[acyl-carrier-protein] synthase II
MNAYITGIGWITADSKGCGREHTHFSMPGGQLAEIKASDIAAELYPNFRRLDAYSRLGLAAVAFALRDAGLDQWEAKRDIGIIVSTVYGCLGTDVDYYMTVIPEGGSNASPALFSYTSANSFLGEAAIYFGLTGTGFAFAEQHPTGLAALQAGLVELFREDSGQLLAGVCDIGCPPLFNQPASVPAGAVFFMLEKSRGRKAQSYGQLHLSGSDPLRFNDNPVTDLTILVQQCLDFRL